MFVQIADTQLGFTSAKVNLTAETANFQKAVEHVNRLKPAFVVISGDLINLNHDPKQIRAFWEVARQIRPDVPLYLVSGNHDVAPAAAENIASYRKLFGKDYYSFNYQGSAFIVLNTSLIQCPESDQAIKKAQREWFEQELKSAKANKSNHIFVLTHHPWFRNNPDEADDYFNILLTDRKEYLSLMDRYGVDYALAGHLHAEASAKAGRLSMITTGAISKSLSKDPVGFRVFKVYKDEVDHTFYPLDQVPENIRL